MADGSKPLTVREFWELPEQERLERYGELSDHDKFIVRITMPTSSNPQYIPCGHCVHRNKEAPACLAFPQGYPTNHVKAVMANPAIECGNGYHFVAEESKE